MDDMRFEKYWKNELVKTANYILEKYSAKINNKQIFCLEKKIMICLLHIRQNRDYYFNPKRKYPKTVELAVYPIKDKKADKYDFGRRYELYGDKKENVELVDLCNYFIHVDIKSDFIPMNDRIFGVFFSSDKKKNVCLYYIALYKIAQILLSIVRDEKIGIEPVFGNGNKLVKFEYTDKW